jgi:DNA-binding LytR/AlgR family response regulator
MSGASLVASPAGRSIGEGQMGSPRVMVCDDDAAILEMIKISLETDGMEVLCCGDGAEALKVLETEHPDVIVLDIMMPKVDGWMVLMEIRNNPKTASIPVIMLTAKTQDLAKILAFKQGAQQYVTKPFNPMELSARIMNLAGTPVRSMAPVEEQPGALNKLAVRKSGRTVLLSVDDIVYVAAKNKSTYVHTAEQQYLTDHTLGELTERLARFNFHRAHRSFLVNLDKVREIIKDDGDYVVVVDNREQTRLPVARRQVRRFRKAVGI